MTPRQQRFVEEYLVDMNAHQAALRAGFSPRSARQIVTKLLRRPEVADAIRAATDARAERLRITADRVLPELARIAFAEIGRLAEWGPDGVTLKPRREITPDDAAAIAEIATGKDGAPTRLKLHDKQRALDGLARHLGLYGRTAGVAAASPEARLAAAKRAREILAERLAALAKATEERSCD
jgi:phage terminase small subunit